MRFVSRWLAMTALAGLPACATVTSGTSQNISVMTEPPGATCQLQREGAVVAVVNPTPGTASISKSSRDLSLRCSRPGSLPAETVMQAQFQAMSAGNILLGGVIGLAVEAASGAMSRYPDSVSLDLPPDHFASATERDTYFDTRTESLRRGYTERLEGMNRDCGGDARQTCAARVTALETERDTQLARLDAQRRDVRIE